MNKRFILGMTAATVLLASCSNDDTADIVINSTITNNNNSGGGTTDPQTIFISGTYTEDLTLDANNTYILNGPLIMTAGTTLNIPAGTTVRALASGSDVYIAIAQGAKISAVGTQDNPIVLTSNASNPQAGDWGGLILLGRAPVNSASGSSTSTSEIGGLPYGGTLPNDDSGIIRYVRIEYSGGSADGQSENNGFSFYGVGNGTTVEYIEAYEGADDGVEFFGGTVNVSYIYLVNNQDDSVDWTEGFSGTLTNVYIAHGGVVWDKAIEADGYNTDIGNNSNPLYFSKPSLNNVTIIGKGSTDTGQDGGVTLGTYEAVRLRAGTQGLFNNIFISGFGEAFDLDGDAGDNPTGAGVLSGDLHIDNITFDDITTRFKNDTGEVFGESDLFSNIGNGTGTDFETWGANWTRN